MKIKSRLSLVALAFAFAVGAGAAFAGSASCLNYCKAEFNDCMSQGSKAWCVKEYNLCRNSCG